MKSDLKILRNFIFQGDYAQLPPVKEKAVYELIQTIHHQSKGKLLYLLFDKVISLKQIMRQSGPDQEEFKKVLKKISHGGFSEKDWHYLNQRNFEKLSEEEKDLFDKQSLMLCARNVDLVPYNVKRLKALGKPIALVRAENQPPSAKSAKPNTAGGLLNCTLLAEGNFVVQCKILSFIDWMSLSTTFHLFHRGTSHAQEEFVARNWSNKWISRKCDCNHL